MNNLSTVERKKIQKNIPYCAICQNRVNKVYLSGLNVAISNWFYCKYCNEMLIKNPKFVHKPIKEWKEYD